MAIIGIDLGTTNSACAIWRDGKTVLISNRSNNYLTPSVVGIDDGGEILVGEAAKLRLVSHPKKTTATFKRYMGSDHTIKLAGKSFTPPELSALILRSLKEDAETYLGEEVTEAIISVPAYFNDSQRKATKYAGELAGLKVERLINEPTAGAIIYGLQNQDEGAKFMVVDLGGGTFDVSIVEYFCGVLEVHASSGDNFLGGEDFLEAMVHDFLTKNELRKEKLGAETLQHIYTELEKIKCQLNSDADIKVESLIPEQTTPWIINRLRFEDISQTLMHRVQSPIERALRDAGLAPNDIDEIVLVGGATRMQIFRSLISRMFRRLPTANLDPDLVVTMGTAVQAGLKEKNKDLQEVVLTDVCPYTLGVEVVNHNDFSGKLGGVFSPIINRNSIVPVSISTTLCTAADKQSALLVNIYQGEARLVKHNVYLGNIEVSVPKKPAGEETIDVRYSYDMNGLLDIDVTVISTGKTYSKTIINAPGDITEDEQQKSRQKLAKLKFHPRERDENKLILSRLEKLYEISLGDDRDYVANITSQLEYVLNQQDPREIEKAQIQITEILEQLEGVKIFE